MRFGNVKLEIIPKKTQKDLKWNNDANKDEYDTFNYYESEYFERAVEQFAQQMVAEGLV